MIILKKFYKFKNFLILIILITLYFKVTMRLNINDLLFK